MDLLSKKYVQAKEIEKLKQDIEAYKQSEQEATEIIAELKAENERLKEEMKQLEDFVKSSDEIDHINHEYTYKLRTCLQEIKKIAEQSNIDCIYRISVIRKILTKAEEE